MNLGKAFHGRNRRLAIAGLAGSILLAAGSSLAGPFAPLSNKHTLQGVSQLWGGDGNRNRGVAIRLDNPGPRTHVAALLVYNRRQENAGTGTAELFNGCSLRVLTSHASLMVDNDDPAFVGVSSSRHYTEVIAVPRSPVPSLGRVADGLGIIVEGGGNDEYQRRPFRALHPTLFNGADTSENASSAVRDCVCDQLGAENLPLDLFGEVGINCPTNG